MDAPCPPKQDARGRLVEQVRVPTPSGGSRCVKAGGAASKAAGKCPAGKVLVSATFKVPRPDGTVKTVDGMRCVRPKGQYEHLKTCPPGQVLVEKMSHGVTPGDRVPWQKAVRVCVRPETASARGYRIVG
jgi:hypothetical protein